MRGSDFYEDPIVIIATLSSMEMKVEVGEHEVVYLHEGDPAEIEIDAFPDRKFPAQVVEIAKNATVKNAGHRGRGDHLPGPPRAHRASVPGALPGHERPGLGLHRDPRPALIVPLQAVTVRTEKELADRRKEPPDGGPPAAGAARRTAAKKSTQEPLQKVVFVVEDGKARVRRVETGLACETEIEIVSGAEGGRAGGGGALQGCSPASWPTARR